MRKIIFICSLICFSLKAHVTNLFEALLISEPPYLPGTRITRSDIGNRHLVERKLSMTIAGSIVHYTTWYLFGKSEITPKKCAECVARILSANEPYIRKYSRTQEYYESDISCLEVPQNKYDACKWMLDESMYIVNTYNPSSMLAQIIDALGIINESQQSTSFSELINGGWKKNDEITRVFKCKQ